MNLMLTEKQIRVLRYFRDYRREHGIAPTLDEAAQALGVSKITIHEHLNQLTKKGAIHRDRAKARAVSVDRALLGELVEVLLSLIHI